MSNQDLDSLINLIKVDHELRQQLASCGTVAEASELLSAAGYSLTEHELLSLRSSASAQELSDVELEGVAGGGDKASNADTCHNRGCQGR
jgi:predicted ribosomally synthesized peptide with nif11-like leader